MVNTQSRLPLETTMGSQPSVSSALLPQEQLPVPPGFSDEQLMSGVSCPPGFSSASNVSCPPGFSNVVSEEQLPAPPGFSGEQLTSGVSCPPGFSSASAVTAASKYAHRTRAEPVAAVRPSVAQGPSPG